MSSLQRRAALLADKIRKEGLVFAPWDDSSFRSLVCKDLGAGNYVSFYHDGGRVYISHEWLTKQKFAKGCKDQPPGITLLPVPARKSQT